MGLIADAICETLWPTRCALCDAPGAVLCTRCAARLDYLDFWRACPRCGAAFGFLQCDHCTPLVNKEEHTRLCVSALRYTADTGVLIKTYKDKGEQRLSETLAAILANALPPSWLRWANGVTYVSATKAARRRRGFDHMELLARSLAGQCGLPCIRALNPPTARDQRILDRTERKQNMQGRFTACEPLPGRRLILIDDVLTSRSNVPARRCVAPPSRERKRSIEERRNPLNRQRSPNSAMVAHFMFAHGKAYRPHAALTL